MCDGEREGESAGGGDEGTREGGEEEGDSEGTGGAEVTDGETAIGGGQTPHVIVVIANRRI